VTAVTGLIATNALQSGNILACIFLNIVDLNMIFILYHVPIFYDMLFVRKLIDLHLISVKGRGHV
jgi:hypothetical protein